MSVTTTVPGLYLPKIQFPPELEFTPFIACGQLTGDAGGGTVTGTIGLEALLPAGSYVVLGSANAFCDLAASNANLNCWEIQNYEVAFNPSGARYFWSNATSDGIGASTVNTKNNMGSQTWPLLLGQRLRGASPGIVKCNWLANTDGDNYLMRVAGIFAPKPPVFDYRYWPGICYI